MRLKCLVKPHDAKMTVEEVVSQAVRRVTRSMFGLRPIAQVHIMRVAEEDLRMIGRINHIAIAVPDVAAAARQWETMLGATVSAPQTMPEHGVRIVFVRAPNGKIELMEPFGEASPIASFLARNENGGMHHICYEVADIVSARKSLQVAGARVLGDGKAKIGAQGNPVLFLHPKDFSGTLIELQQVADTDERQRVE